MKSNIYNNNDTQKVKFIAFHLPQFHSFKENDEWWGENFTEWTNTKKAERQYRDHRQPKEPQYNNYYNMLDHSTRKWQSELAQKYSVYGFCYYHYWFNGKLLMEKPLELLLNDKDIELPFCLCWANEPWTKAWDGGDKKVLMPQKYGGKEDWKNHFRYLLSFFKDERYIKIDNKPVMVLYRTENIDDCENMIEYWNQECIKIGFDGIYIVEELNTFQDKSTCANSEAVLEFEPMYTIGFKRSFVRKCIDKNRNNLKKIALRKNISWYNYDNLWKNIINRKRKHDKKTFLGAFVDWDNTARKNSNATIVLGATPQKFEKYLQKQCEIAEKNDSEFVFINAWNEWAEGAYLEPDKDNGYAYLEALLKVQNTDII